MLTNHITSNFFFLENHQDKENPLLMSLYVKSLVFINKMITRMVSSNH
jgi:hypothetical protein